MLLDGLIKFCFPITAINRAFKRIFPPHYFKKIHNFVLPLWHDSVLPEIRPWLQKSLMGTYMEPGKQKRDSLSDTLATCDTAVALQLCWNIHPKSSPFSKIKHAVKYTYSCNSVSVQSWNINMYHKILTFSSRLAMESKVSSEPNSRALFLLFSSSSTPSLLSLFNSSWRSVSNSPVLSWTHKQTYCHFWRDQQRNSIQCHPWYLQQLLSILQEVKAVLDPTSGDVGTLHSVFFPLFTCCFAWTQTND